MPDLLNIGLSGLNSSRIGLSVTGQNITNINTEGYSRQTADFSARDPQFLGGFFLGTGTETETIRRISNDFLVASERSDIAVFSKAETFSGQVDQMDQLFSNNSSGLSGNLSSFFSSLQTAVDGPSSVEARQVFLSTADRLTKKFEDLQGRLLTRQSDIGRQAESVTQQVTNLAKEIGSINHQIRSAISSSGEPNDLLDRRDQALRELSKLIDISVVPIESNSISISVGNGQPLVVGTEVFELTTQVDPNNSDVKELVTRSQTGATTVVGNNISGGLLGGLLDAQYGLIDNALNNLGRLALGVAGAVNTVHNLGLDLNDNLGGNLFTGINSANSVANRTVASGGNASPGDQVVSVNVSDVSQLTTSDYQLSFTGPTSYVLTRLSDNKNNTALDASVTGSIGALPATLTVDGLTVDLSRPSGDFSTGDSFLLRPTRGFSNEIKLQIDKAESLALASPVRTSKGLNNTGTAIVSAGEVIDKTTAFFTATAKALSPPVVIQFTSATTYNILDNSNPSAPVALVPAQTGLTYPPTSGNGVLPTSFGFQVDITGTPANGDTFGVSYNTGGVLDNRIGLALTKVQTAGLLGGGRLKLEEAYGVFTQEIGSRASSARSDLEASKVLLEQAQELQQSVSGVNLDEEAATLVEFEQAYNASAQVISIARSIFDTLIAAVR